MEQKYSNAKAVGESFLNAYFSSKAQDVRQILRINRPLSFMLMTLSFPLNPKFSAELMT